MGKLGLNDSLAEIVVKMCEGSRGAMSCIMGISYHKGWYGGIDSMMVILWLDELEVYGEKLSTLWNECCSYDLGELEKIVRAYQLGFMTKKKVHAHLEGGHGRSFSLPSVADMIIGCVPEMVAEALTEVNFKAERSKAMTFNFEKFYGEAIDKDKETALASVINNLKGDALSDPRVYRSRGMLASSRQCGRTDFDNEYLLKAINIHEAIEQSLLPRDGEPCSHRGCLSHMSHPCEGCGRVGGKSLISTVCGIKEAPCCICGSIGIAHPILGVDDDAKEWVCEACAEVISTDYSTIELAVLSTPDLQTIYGVSRQCGRTDFTMASLKALARDPNLPPERPSEEILHEVMCSECGVIDAELQDGLCAECYEEDQALKRTVEFESTETEKF